MANEFVTEDSIILSHYITNAPEFTEMVVAENGAMARLTTVHPSVFVTFKRWMSKEPDRDPLKRRRDALQADAVEWALNERLPQLGS